MSESLIIEDKYIFPETSAQEHWHTPSSGGEICWNNQQWGIRMNALIKLYNRSVSLQSGEHDYVPYIAVPAHPTIGYNVHHHTSEFDGGLIFGSGMHDHRDQTQAGFAYAVYHTGSQLPQKPYEREEVYQ